MLDRSVSHAATPTWQRPFSRMEVTRSCVGCTMRRLCGSARVTTVGYRERGGGDWRGGLALRVVERHGLSGKGGAAEAKRV